MPGLKARALRLLSAAGGSALARACCPGARILAYHGVDPIQDPRLNFDGFQVPPEVFAAQLDHLKRHYTVRPLAEVVDGLLGRCPLPPRAVAITFDDGYANNLAVAAPLLRARGLPATFFVTTGFLDGTHQPWWYRVRAACLPAEAIRREAALKDLPAAQREVELAKLPATGPGPYAFLDWAAARELVRQGFTVGPHTLTHPALARETPDVQRREIMESVRRVAEETGCAPDVFSYPYGGDRAHDDAVAGWVRAAGCRAALTTAVGRARVGGDPFQLPRLSVTGRHVGASFAALVSGLRGWLQG